MEWSYARPGKHPYVRAVVTLPICFLLWVNIHPNKRHSAITRKIEELAVTITLEV